MKQDWDNRYTALKSAAEHGEQAVSNGTAYIFRVAGFYFEAGFAAYVLDLPDWRPLLQRSVELFERSANADDCQKKDPRFFPFNQVRLYLKWYLALLLLGEEANSELLDRSINLNVEALWSKKQQPIEAFTILALQYLMRKDFDHLEKLWQFLTPRRSPEKFPAQLAFWYRLAALVPENEKKEGFWQAFKEYRSTLKQPTDEMGLFYISATRIASSVLGLSDPLDQISRKLVE